MPEVRRTPEEIALAKKKAKRTLEKRQISEEKKSVLKAGNALFAIAILGVLGDLISLLRSPDEIQNDILIFIGVFMAIFLGLGVWAKKKPYPAILTGLIIFTLIQLLILLGEPAAVFQGLIFKGIVYWILIKGLKNAKKHTPTKPLQSEEILDA